MWFSDYVLTETAERVAVGRRSYGVHRQAAKAAGRDASSMRRTVEPTLSVLLSWWLLESVRAENACADHRYQRTEELAANLSATLKNDKSLGYTHHGLFGIFNPSYKQVKTRLIWEGLCHLPPPVTICETGFNAGLSALLMLEAAPSARLVSFDYGDFKWTRAADRALRAVYPPERFWGVQFGNSVETIPQFAASHRTFSCDAILLDGGKEYSIRMADLRNLRNISKPGARLFLDEVAAPPGSHAPPCSLLGRGTALVSC